MSAAVAAVVEEEGAPLGRDLFFFQNNVSLLLQPCQVSIVQYINLQNLVMTAAAASASASSRSGSGSGSPSALTAPAPRPASPETEDDGQLTVVAFALASASTSASTSAWEAVWASGVRREDWEV